MKILKMGAVLAFSALAPLCALSAVAQEPEWAPMAEANGALTAIKQVQARAHIPHPPAASKNEVVPPSAPEEDWHKILKVIESTGEFAQEENAEFMLPGQPPIWTYSLTSDSSNGEKADHTLDYAAIRGVVNEANLFEPRMGVFSSGKWKLRKDGGWQIDQWMFMTDIYGTVHNFTHIVVVLDADKNHVSDKPEELSPVDPRIAAKYNAVIKYWAAKPAP